MPLPLFMTLWPSRSRALFWPIQFPAYCLEERLDGPGLDGFPPADRKIDYRLAGEQ